MHQRDVEGAGLEEALHPVVEVLGLEVVDVALEDRHAIASDAAADPSTGAQHVRQRPERSLPAPKPMRSTVIAGSVQNSSTTVRTIAAPVGVTVSQAMPAGTIGTPRSSSSVAGAGQRQACRARCSTSRGRAAAASGHAIAEAARQAIAAPVTSTIASTAPTSWKCTSRRGCRARAPRRGERLEDRERAVAHRRREARAVEQPADLA